MRYALALFSAAVVQFPTAPPDKVFTNTMLVWSLLAAAFVLLFAHINDRT